MKLHLLKNLWTSFKMTTKLPSAQPSPVKLCATAPAHLPCSFLPLGTRCSHCLECAPVLSLSCLVNSDLLFRACFRVLSSPKVELVACFSELAPLFGNTALPMVIVSGSVSLCSIASRWSALPTHAERGDGDFVLCFSVCPPRAARVSGCSVHCVTSACVSPAATEHVGAP